MNVEFSEPPIVLVNNDARIEVIVPTSGATEAWYAAFERALPTRRGYYRRIKIGPSGISFTVKDEQQLEEYLSVIDEAASRTNRRLSAAEAKVPGIASRARDWLRARDAGTG